jgi:hypothetical protein
MASYQRNTHQTWSPSWISTIRWEANVYQAKDELPRLNLTKFAAQAEEPTEHLLQHQPLDQAWYPSLMTHASHALYCAVLMCVAQVLVLAIRYNQSKEVLTIEATIREGATPFDSRTTSSLLHSQILSTETLLLSSFLFLSCTKGGQ